MAACNHCRVAQYDAELIVLPFSMKSTSSTPFQTQSGITITLPTGLPMLNFFDRRDLGSFHPIFACFVFSDIVFEEIMTMNGILLGGVREH